MDAQRGLTFVSHGPSGSGPSLMMNALAAAVRVVRPNLDVDVVDLAGRDGAEAIELIHTSVGDTQLLASCTPTYLTTPIKQDLPFRVSDLTAIAGLVTDTYLLAVRTGHPRANLETLFEQPTVAAAAPFGGNTHIQAMLISQICAGVEIAFLPSAAAALQAVVDGDADWTTGVATDFVSQLASERLTVLGTFEAPGIGSRPTLAAAGIDVIFPLWRGVVAPPTISPISVRHWETLIGHAQNTEPWQSYLRRSGLRAAEWDHTAFRKVLDDERIRYEAWVAMLDRQDQTG